MISPMTAPGTWVEIIETAVSFDGEEGLVGTRFQVGEIIPAAIVPSGYGALNPATELYHCLSILKVVELPKAITDCLENVDITIVIDEFRKQEADADMRARMPYALLVAPAESHSLHPLCWRSSLPSRQPADGDKAALLLPSAPSSSQAFSQRARRQLIAV